MNAPMAVATRHATPTSAPGRSGMLAATSAIATRNPDAAPSAARTIRSRWRAASMPFRRSKKELRQLAGDAPCRIRLPCVAPSSTAKSTAVWRTYQC